MARSLLLFRRRAVAQGAHWSLGISPSDFRSDQCAESRVDYDGNRCQQTAISRLRNFFRTLWKTGLAYSQIAGTTSTALKKANLLKGRDAKLPVYGLDLRQRGCQRTGCITHLVCVISRAVPVLSNLTPEIPQQMLHNICASASRSSWLFGSQQDGDRLNETLLKQGRDLRFN